MIDFRPVLFTAPRPAARLGRSTMRAASASWAFLPVLTMGLPARRVTAAAGAHSIAVASQTNCFVPVFKAEIMRVGSRPAEHVPASLRQHRVTLAGLVCGVRSLSATSCAEPDRREPKIISKSIEGSTRWLHLVKLHWQDDRGRRREWDAVERPFEVDASAPIIAPQASAVAVLPVLKMEGGSREVVLISQYRPPLGSMCMEAPAGLVGPGEHFADTAMRELKEETGLTSCRVLDDDAAVLCNDPGITNAACRLIIVEVDANDPVNAQALKGIEEGRQYGVEEEGESIKLWRLPLKGLRTQLNKLSDQGYAVDGKLHCFARGLDLAQSLGS